MRSNGILNKDQMRVEMLPRFIVAVIIAAIMTTVGSALQQSAAVVFTNIAAQAGINFKHENGASPQKFMPETMGAGALIFDYDNDGWPDIFLVNGGSFVDSKVAAAARHRLYHNNRNSTFTVLQWAPARPTMTTMDFPISTSPALPRTSSIATTGRAVLSMSPPNRELAAPASGARVARLVTLITMAMWTSL
jgi:hypothetical protein